MDKKTALDYRYLRMADIWAENSYCARRKVGALIVKDKRIISDGYNGTPSGFENVCEDEDGLTKPYVLHAEANAITKMRDRATTQTAPHFMSPTNLASNVQSSSSKPAFGVWSTCENTVCTQDWSC